MSSSKRLFPLIAALLALLTTTAALPGSYEPPEDPPESEEIWSNGAVTVVEVARDGTLLFAKWEGPAYRLDPGADEAEVVFDPPVIRGPEWGFVGLALAPDFEETGDFYAAYTTGPEGTDASDKDVEGTMRIVRVHEGEETLIYEYEATRFHNSGRLLLHDNLLWVAQGEHNEREYAEDPGSEYGKILRMTLEGEPAPGNPHETDPEWHPYAYSMGHRNPFGLDYDEKRDILVVSTPGQDEMDEVTAIEKGGHAGWPGCWGPCDPPQEDKTDPIVWYPDVVTPVGLEVIGDDYFTGTMNYGEVRRIFETDEGWKDEVIFQHDKGLLDVQPTADQKWLYYGAFDGLYRIPLPESYWIDLPPADDTENGTDADGTEDNDTDRAGFEDPVDGGANAPTPAPGVLGVAIAASVACVVARRSRRYP